MSLKSISHLVVLILATSAAPSITFADSLTRSNCWAADYSDGSKRTLCFVSSRRVTMTNAGRTTDNKWSTCKWSGDYKKQGADVTVTFHQNSGKCTNGASSPEFTAVCQFSGENLSCKGSSIVDGKTYQFAGTFK